MVLCGQWFDAPQVSKRYPIGSKHTAKEGKRMWVWFGGRAGFDRIGDIIMSVKDDTEDPK